MLSFINRIQIIEDGQEISMTGIVAVHNYSRFSQIYLVRIKINLTEHKQHYMYLGLIRIAIWETQIHAVQKICSQV